MKTFEETIELLKETVYDITDRETLRQYAIDNAHTDGYENLAIHILEALRDNDADYFQYDYSMGTLSTPKPLKDYDDLLNEYPDEMEDLENE